MGRCEVRVCSHSVNVDLINGGGYGWGRSQVFSIQSLYLRSRSGRGCVVVDSQTPNLHILSGRQYPLDNQRTLEG